MSRVAISGCLALALLRVARNQVCLVAVVCVVVVVFVESGLSAGVDRSGTGCTARGHGVWVAGLQGGRFVGWLDVHLARARRPECQRVAGA